MRLLFLTIFSIFAQNLTERELNGIIQTFLLNYDKTERAGIDEQLTVTLDCFVQGLSDLREAQMDYEITIFFRQVNSLKLVGFTVCLILKMDF